MSIDYERQRIYWADSGEGIYFRIESSNLNGKERQIVFEGTHIKPFAVAVDSAAIYWTDVNSNALWRIEKVNLNSAPENIRNFTESPYGMVVRNGQISKIEVCKNLADAIEKYNDSLEEVALEEKEKSVTTTEMIEERLDGCLNGGQFVDGYCKCTRGFSGQYCHISLCHNYCIQGGCYMSSIGYPMCRCKTGFDGNRCQHNVCDGFCLNNGKCNMDEGGNPQCQCGNDFVGSRCEMNVSFKNLCKLYCDTASGESLPSADGELICRYLSFLRFLKRID